MMSDTLASKEQTSIANELEILRQFAHDCRAPREMRAVEFVAEYVKAQAVELEVLGDHAEDLCMSAQSSPEPPDEREKPVSDELERLAKMDRLIAAGGNLYDTFTQLRGLVCDPHSAQPPGREQAYKLGGECAAPWLHAAGCKCFAAVESFAVGEARSAWSHDQRMVRLEDYEALKAVRAHLERFHLFGPSSELATLEEHLRPHDAMCSYGIALQRLADEVPCCCSRPTKIAE
jgi:hypothetical protein